MAGFDPSLQPTDSRGHLLTEQSNTRSARLDQLEGLLVKAFPALRGDAYVAVAGS